MFFAVLKTQLSIVLAIAIAFTTQQAGGVGRSPTKPPFASGTAVTVHTRKRNLQHFTQ